MSGRESKIRGRTEGKCGDKAPRGRQVGAGDRGEEREREREGERESKTD